MSGATLLVAEAKRYRKLARSMPENSMAHRLFRGVAYSMLLNAYDTKPLVAARRLARREKNSWYLA